MTNGDQSYSNKARSYSGPTMAQSRRVKPDRHKKPRPPLQPASLEQLALFYVGRYATTRARLRRYLARKIGERGWAGDTEPALDALVARLVELGYVDDRAFAAARAAALRRRGFGDRRVDQALVAAGVAGADREAEAGGEAAWTTALRFAARKRLGPYAAAPADAVARRRGLAAMLRAGHSFDIARRLLDAAPGDIPHLDSI